ncbi:MAG: hypothetical protein AVDCRST_MAG41-1894, partial [uncultured Corynebacteriales bacterium]
GEQHRRAHLTAAGRAPRPADEAEPRRDGHPGAGGPAGLRRHLVRAGRRPDPDQPGRGPQAAGAPAPRPAGLADRPGRCQLVHPRQHPGQGRGAVRRHRPVRHRPAVDPLRRQPVPGPGPRPGQRLDRDRPVARLGRGQEGPGRGREL